MSGKRDPAVARRRRAAETIDAMYKAPRGTHDVLPDDYAVRTHIVATAARVAELAGYRPIDTPIIEDADLFVRGVGDATDIVEKEMYIFEDRGVDRLALRPEPTAAICRAYLEHGLANEPQPVKLWARAINFRYERPQAGRYRQFEQFDIEALVDGVDLDGVAVLHKGQGPALGGFGGDVAQHQAAGGAREAAVGDQGHRLA